MSTLMLFEFQALEPDQYPIAIATAVISTVIAVLYFVIRSYLCRTRGHKFDEIAAFPSSETTMTIAYTCGRCGFKRYDTETRVAQPCAPTGSHC